MSTRTFGPTIRQIPIESASEQFFPTTAWMSSGDVKEARWLLMLRGPSASGATDAFQTRGAFQVSKFDPKDTAAANRNETAVNVTATDGGTLANGRGYGEGKFTTGMVALATEYANYTDNYWVRFGVMVSTIDGSFQRSEVGVTVNVRND